MWKCGSDPLLFAPTAPSLSFLPFTIPPLMPAARVCRDLCLWRNTPILPTSLYIVLGPEVLDSAAVFPRTPRDITLMLILKITFAYSSRLQWKNGTLFENSCLLCTCWSKKLKEVTFLGSFWPSNLRPSTNARNLRHPTYNHRERREMNALTLLVVAAVIATAMSFGFNGMRQRSGMVSSFTGAPSLKSVDQCGVTSSH